MYAIAVQQYLDQHLTFDLESTPDHVSSQLYCSWLISKAGTSSLCQTVPVWMSQLYLLAKNSTSTSTKTLLPFMRSRVLILQDGRS